jgi:hypothetical protein
VANGRLPNLPDGSPTPLSVPLRSQPSSCEAVLPNSCGDDLCSSTRSLMWIRNRPKSDLFMSVISVAHRLLCKAPPPPERPPHACRTEYVVCEIQNWSWCATQMTWTPLVDHIKKKPSKVASNIVIPSRGKGHCGCYACPVPHLGIVTRVVGQHPAEKCQHKCCMHWLFALFGGWKQPMGPPMWPFKVSATNSPETSPIQSL